MTNLYISNKLWNHIFGHRFDEFMSPKLWLTTTTPKVKHQWKATWFVAFQDDIHEKQHFICCYISGRHQSKTTFHLLYLQEDRRKIPEGASLGLYREDGKEHRKPVYKQVEQILWCLLYSRTFSNNIAMQCVGTVFQWYISLFNTNRARKPFFAAYANIIEELKTWPAKLEGKCAKSLLQGWRQL